jgi:SAM-dependent methyltransferase
LTTTLVDLGATPLANAFVTPEQAAAHLDRAWPLHVRVCDACLLAQVDTVVPADSIFSDYPYLSSFSSGWVAHARRFAEATIPRFGLGAGSLVMEVASNDGYLLRHFVAHGIPVLGIEPAANVAAVARAAGVATRVAFFGAETARILVGEGVCADLIVANNVLAHVPDIAGFMAGLSTVLAPQGVATFEFPHVLRLLEGVQFDTIYHEHYSYLSLLVVERVLAGAGLRAFDVVALPTHGGSLRVYACHAAARHAGQPSVARVRAEERAAHLDRPDGYRGFAVRVAAVQREFRTFLAAGRAAGRRVAAYGAAAKGNTLLNTCGVGVADIACVADRNPAKQGRLLPGSHIPVVAPHALLRAAPDDVVILPWNIAEEIAGELAPLRKSGTRFWVAVPDLAQV